MHPIEQQIYEFIEACVLGEAELTDDLVEEFGERAKAALKEKFSELKEETFRLRMSNIGKPLRQLMLEKEFGRGKPTPDFILKMLYGSLYEALTILLLRASKVNLTEYDKKVVLAVAGANIEGTLDVKIDGKVYDVKTASPYSYEHKFNSWESLASSDDLGYLAQGFGYAAADKCPFGGWLVINKSTGQLKVISIPDDVQEELGKKYVQEITAKVDHINKNLPMPECKEAIEETYYKKPTGNIVLGDKCRFCPHKGKCHPTIKYAASTSSKSENPPYKWYIKMKEADVQEQSKSDVSDTILRSNI